MSDNEPLLVERTGAVVTLVNNDPPRNRMTLDYMDALEAWIERIRDDDAVRAVVITAAGDAHFSVGMDLKQLPEGVERMGSIDAVFDQRLRVLGAIERLGKPVVATLFGYCLGEVSSFRSRATSGSPRPKARRSACRRWSWGRCRPGAAPRGSPAASAGTTPST